MREFVKANEIAYPLYRIRKGGEDLKNFHKNFGENELVRASLLQLRDIGLIACKGEVVTTCKLTELGKKVSAVDESAFK